METKYKVIIVVVGLTTAFAVGRYTVPEKVKVETKIVEIEKKVQDKQKKTKVIQEKKPDGTVITTTTVDEDTKTSTKDDKNIDKTNEIVRGDSKVTISLLGGYDFINNKPTVGASIYKPVLGPIGIGVFGFTNSTVGASVGLSF